MKPVNLTPLQKDYAVYLPAISSFFSTYIAKQRKQEFVPTDRIPQGFDRCRGVLGECVSDAAISRRLRGI